VAAIEWLDPVFVAGHWTPQLIEYAGGEDVLGFAGEHSHERTWAEVAASEPDVVIVMPCGYDAEIAHREAEMHRDELAALGAREVVAVDASAYFSRPGPRIVDGLELLAHILHPELVPRAPGAAQSLTATGGTFGAVVGAPVMGLAIERLGFSAAWSVIAIVPLAALIGTFFIRGEEDFA
jgi:iron complex transport system substrate-binding protein